MMFYHHSAYVLETVTKVMDEAPKVADLANYAAEIIFDLRFAENYFLIDDSVYEGGQGCAKPALAFHSRLYMDLADMLTKLGLEAEANFAQKNGQYLHKRSQKLPWEGQPPERVTRTKLDSDSDLRVGKQTILLEAIRAPASNLSNHQSSEGASFTFLYPDYNRTAELQNERTPLLPAASTADTLISLE